MTPLSEVAKILGVKSKKTVYDMMKVAQVTGRKLEGKGNVTFLDDGEIEQLKQVREWVASGNKIANYAPTELFLDLSSELSVRGEVNNPQQLDFFAQLTESLVTTVTDKIVNSLRSPINHWKELVYAQENDLLLTTDEIMDIIKVKPKGETFERGTFIFIRHGKIGRQTAWRVERTKTR